MKIKLHIVASLLVASVVVVGAIAHYGRQAGALSSSAAVDVNVVAGCVSTANGSTDVTPNSTVSLTVTNYADVVSQSVSGGGVFTTVGINSKTATDNPKTISVGVGTNPVTVTFTPIPSSGDGYNENTCPIGSNPVPSSIMLNPAGATLACKLQGTSWILSGSFTGHSNGTGVYGNGSQTINITAPGNFSRTIAAGSSAQTYAVIDGLGKGYTLASTTCPKYVANTPTTTPTPAAAVPAPANDTASTGDSAAIPADEAKAKPRPDTQTIDAHNTHVVTQAGLIVVLLLVLLALLDITGIWNAPRKFASKLGRRKKKLTKKKSSKKRTRR